MIKSILAVVVGAIVLLLSYFFLGHDWVLSVYLGVLWGIIVRFATDTAPVLQRFGGWLYPLLAVCSWATIHRGLGLPGQLRVLLLFAVFSTGMAIAILSIKAALSIKNN